jgi:hypothetical protein
LQLECCILFCFFLNSCSENHLNEQDLNVFSDSKEIKLSVKLDSLVDIYIAENNISGCFNEIHIDKQLPDYTILTFRTVSNIPLQLKNNKPLFYFKKKGNLFFVYTGLEKYFELENNCKKCVENIIPSEESIFWYVIDSFNVVTINRDFSYPFFPLPQKPTIKFKAQKL